MDRIENLINLNKYTGNYGGNNSAYYALTESIHKTNIKRNKKYIHRNPIQIKKNKNWERIITFNPNGMISKIPTISAVKTKMTIPELLKCKRDGNIVNNDGSINCIKIAIEQVWDIPNISIRLNIDESYFRKKLFKYYNNPDLLDAKKPLYFPPIGGSTIYLFGDLNNYTKVASRVHDECNGSDVFGSHICSCRPYLMFSIQEAVKYAQNGDLGIIVYNRKEGRSLGEVIKFSVYNGRKNQKGGDDEDKYFSNTENYCGVRDARVQKLMPDIFLWLGIETIDLWLSMSNEKSDALKDIGIKIIKQEQVPLEILPKDSLIEINAKIKDGYYSNQNT